METRQQHIGVPTTGDAGADHLRDTAFAFWRAALLLNAEEIGLFAALAHGPADAATLGARLGLDAEMATDLLDALVVAELIERHEGTYRNTDAAARFLDPTQPAYLGNWLDMARAAQRDTAAAMDRLRVTAASGRAATPPSRMWAEIAAIITSQE